MSIIHGSEIEAVFFDLNGTTIPENSPQPPDSEVAAAIREANYRTRLIAATGMSPQWTRLVCDDLMLGRPAIVANGSQIVDFAQESPLWTKLVSAETIAHADELAGQHDINWHLFAVGKGQTDNRDQASAVIFKDVDTELAAGITPEIEAMGVNIVQFPSKTDDRLTTIKIAHRLATKGGAALALMSWYGIDPERTACIGNDSNDFSLYSVVGRTYAVANAVPELKAEADVVVGSQADHGIVDMFKDLDLIQP